MRRLIEDRFPLVILFVIILMIITVVSWKSCSSESKAKHPQNLSVNLVVK